MLRQLLVSAVLAWTAITPSALAAPAAQLLTAEDISRPAVFTQADFSPDGTRIASIFTDEHDTQSLVVLGLKDQKKSVLQGGEDYDVAGFRWVGNDRIIFNVLREKLYSWGLYVAELNHMADYYTLNHYDVTSIIGLPQNRPGHVLVWSVQASGNKHLPGNLVEIDIARAKDEIRNPIDRYRGFLRKYSPPKDGIVVGWLANREGDLALCLTYAEGRTKLHRYQRSSDSWREVPLDLEALHLMGLDFDERYFWVVSHSKEKGYELRRCNLETGELGEPVYSDPTYDLSEGRLYFSERTCQLVGVRYDQRGPITCWFTPEFHQIQALVDASYPDTANILVDYDRTERNFLYRATSPQQPGIDLLLKLDDRTLQPLSHAAPWLESRPLRPMKPIDFRTRDGVKLEGYVTLPEGADQHHPAPLVVLVHGGPWVRDTLGFNPEVQFLSSRGYAVLQPNYRGSTGYAPGISRDHRFDFRRMHDDVTDATKAILQSGLVDPHRVAIMGGGFGGYLAICGVAFEDNLYRCAVSVDGIFDWEAVIANRRPGSLPGEFETLRDKLGSDRQRFEQISPLSHVDQIRVPVFLGHGTIGFAVDNAQSLRLAAALKKRGVPHETFFRAGEGHGFYDYTNRVEFYHQVEAFLAANLGDPAPTPEK
jgi:dipeptidyl aminopeptidase/acylaminoacyl peptidase